MVTDNMVYAQIIAELTAVDIMQITLQARRWLVEPKSPWCEDGVWSARNLVEPTKAGSEKR